MLTVSRILWKQLRIFSLAFLALSLSDSSELSVDMNLNNIGAYDQTVWSDYLGLMNHLCGNLLFKYGLVSDQEGFDYSQLPF